MPMRTHMHLHPVGKRLYAGGLPAVWMINQTGNRLAAETASYLSTVLSGMLT